MKDALSVQTNPGLSFAFQRSEWILLQAWIEMDLYGCFFELSLLRTLWLGLISVLVLAN